MPDRYIRFGKAYRRFRDLQTQLVCSRSISEIHSSARDQMMFVTTLLHERAGTNPNFPKLHREAIDAALAASPESFDCRVLDDEGFPETVWKEFATRCPKPNRNHTYGPVAGTLRLLGAMRRPTWSGLLQTLTPEEAWDRLDGLEGVGPKLASFMLREFQAFFCVWSAPRRDCWYCFMPVDRWVLRVVQQLWPKEKWSSNSLASAKPYRALSQKVAERFSTNDKAMDFNMGAWFLNAKRNEILALHGRIVVGDVSDVDIHNVAASLDAERVTAALSALVVPP